LKLTGRLCIITDVSVQSRYSHIDIAEMAVRGGADIIQLRDKELPAGEMTGIAKFICRLCRKKNVTFIVNDRADIALASDADGVHLGLDDISVKEARKLLGKDKIIGGTAHFLAQALDAQKQGADYIGYGHIFKTYSKYKPEKPKGIEGLREIIQNIKIPVFAIGGINHENSREIISAGCHGIAVIGSVALSDNPEKAVKLLRKIVYA
jgi:thiamine-phosphate pyrophosphorylase